MYSTYPISQSFSGFIRDIDVSLSIKVPETITHVKRLDVNKGAITYFEGLF